MKIAAIDIGSNAARLLIVEVMEDNGNDAIFRKVNLVRIPLRLGFDVFETQKISKEKEAMILQMIIAFKQLLLIYNINHLKACATSSLRDAINGKSILRKIKNKTGIAVKIISGKEESKIIYRGYLSQIKKKNIAHLFIDVGGGSTEVTFFEDGVKKYSNSFNIGTIRLIKNIVSHTVKKNMDKELKKMIKSSKPIVAVGTGGNINKIFSINKTKEGKPMKLQELEKWHKNLAPLTVKERILKFGLRDDRADVIVHALEIFLHILALTKIEKILVPKIGLADGIINEIYQNIKKNDRH